MERDDGARRMAATGVGGKGAQVGFGLRDWRKRCGRASALGYGATRAGYGSNAAQGLVVAGRVGRAAIPAYFLPPDDNALKPRDALSHPDFQR